MNPPLMTAEGLYGLVFLATLALVVSGALIATNAGRMIHAVSGLAVCMTGVAGLYYFLQSPFVAVMQMLIYVGAVCVVIVFAIMMADPRPELKPTGGSLVGGFLAILLGGLVTWGLAHLGATTGWTGAETVLNNGSMDAIGVSLLTTYSFVFELISVVLLVAIIGALVLARDGRTSIRKNP